MKNFIFILIITFLFSVNSSFSATVTADEKHQYTPRIDSLLNVINHSSEEELSSNYINLHVALYELDNADIHLKYNQQFIDAAKAANNKKRECIARALKVESIYNYNLPNDIFFSEAMQAIDFMRGIPEVEKLFFFTCNMVSEKYTLSGNYDEALRFTDKFYQEAKLSGNPAGIAAALQSMGKAYEALEELDKAEVAYREMISMKSKIEMSVRSDAYVYLIDILVEKKQYNEALKICIDYENSLKSVDTPSEKSKGTFNSLWSQNSISYAKVYRALGQFDKAEQYIEKAETYPVAATNVGIAQLRLVRFLILQDQKKYAEAEAMLDLFDDGYGNTSGYVTRIDLLETRANLYYLWGKFEKSANAYKDYIALKDSLQKVEIATRLNTLRTQYEVDKLEMQKEEQKRTLHNAIFWFSVVFILLCVVITVVITNARKVRAKNRSLLDRIREQDELEDRYEQMRSEVAKNNIITPTENNEDENLGDIYFRMKELMKDPTVFTDPNINRKVIAESLGTNEKYIFDTIKEYYGTNISDYINNLRLNYARNQLALPSDKRTIDAIAIEAGFNSRSVFYRLFKEYYGMTPLEFRKLVAGS